MEVAFQEDAGVGRDGDVVGINRLFYQFPIGENVTATFGAKVRQDDMLAMWPSVYPSDSVLDLFTYAGNRGAYSLNLGGGIGLWYEKDGFSVSWNYVSNEIAAENANLGVGDFLHHYPAAWLRQPELGRSFRLHLRKRPSLQGFLRFNTNNNLA